MNAEKEYLPTTVTMTQDQRRNSISAIQAAIVAACLLFACTTKRSSSSLRNTNKAQRHRDLDALPKEPDSIYMPDSIYIRSESNVEFDEESRKNCQFIFAISVEGSMHPDAFAPILSALAQAQDEHYEIPSARQQKTFRRAIFSSDVGRSSPDDIKNVVSDICPKDGRRRIYLNEKTWPNGLKSRDTAWHVSYYMLGTSNASPNSIHVLIFWFF